MLCLTYTYPFILVPQGYRRYTDSPRIHKLRNASLADVNHIFIVSWKTPYQRLPTSIVSRAISSRTKWLARITPATHTCIHSRAYDYELIHPRRNVNVNLVIRCVQLKYVSRVLQVIFCTSYLIFCGKVCVSLWTLASLNVEKGISDATIGDRRNEGDYGSNLAVIIVRRTYSSSLVYYSRYSGCFRFTYSFQFITFASGPATGNTQVHYYCLKTTSAWRGERWIGFAFMKVIDLRIYRSLEFRRCSYMNGT